MESMAEAAGVWQKSRDLLPQMLSLSLPPPLKKTTKKHKNNTHAIKAKRKLQFTLSAGTEENVLWVTT